MGIVYSWVYFGINFKRALIKENLKILKFFCMKEQIIQMLWLLTIQNFISSQFLQMVNNYFALYTWLGAELCFYVDM